MTSLPDCFQPASRSSHHRPPSPACPKEQAAAPLAHTQIPPVTSTETFPVTSLQARVPFTTLTPAAGTTDTEVSELVHYPCSAHGHMRECEYTGKKLRNDLMRKYKNIEQNVVFSCRAWPDKCTDWSHFTCNQPFYTFLPVPPLCSL